MLNPSEAALISCRFPKGIALSDVQLHVQDEAKGLVPDLQKMSLHSKIHDRMHSLRTNDIQLNHPSAQYSSDLKPRKNFDEENGMRSNVDPNTNNRYPRSPNFNHKSVPTQFVIEKDYGLASQSEQLHPIRADLSQSLNRTIPHIRKECSPELISQPQSIGMIHRRGSASAFLPYSECCAGSGNPHAGQRHRNEGVKQGQPVEQKVPVDAGCNSNRSEQKLHGNANVASDQLSVSHTQKEPGRPGIHYVTGKHVIQSETQMPIAIPKSIKDLAFSTYEQTNLDPNELINKNVNPICDYENPSDPYFANQNLIKEIVSKANARSFTLLTDRNVTAEDTGTKMGNIKSPKKLSNMIPSSSGIHEDCVYPSDVKIGPIQDIDVEYPEIEVAVRGTDDVYEDYSPDSIKEILNNIKLPDCRYCRKPFEENEFAVTIDRADVLFHAKCFKCAGCNQMLVDNMYFYHKETDNIYCGRDYAKVRGVPRCKACDELIFTKEYTLAENATFHLKHFCCIECDIPLANRQYTLEDGMPYCLPCFEQSKANKCSGCLNVIKPDEFGCSLNGTHFHATDECFACMVCKKPLMGKKLLLRNDRLYCSHECYGLPK
ncbi:unnamed protein product [Acanthoscelides obtectus]|nr:unnamed protein product [Acanthoscelides obtectus]CAK1670192.1 Testin [Acanthoscelides obtectus]